ERHAVTARRTGRILRVVEQRVLIQRRTVDWRRGEVRRAVGDRGFAELTDLRLARCRIEVAAALERRDHDGRQRRQLAAIGGLTVVWAHVEARREVQQVGRREAGEQPGQCGDAV